MQIFNQNLIFNKRFYKNSVSAKDRINRESENIKTGKFEGLTKVQSEALKNQRISFTSNPMKEKTFKGESGESVAFKNGIAISKDTGLAYTGSIKFKDKSGSEWELVYKEGLISRSIKNGELYKQYTRYEEKKDRYGDIIPDEYEKYVDLFGEKVFSDGTKMPSNQYFEYKPKITSIHSKKGAKNVYTDIISNPSAKYTDEPRIIVIKNSPDENTSSYFTYRKPNGETKTEFKSIDEANDYFKNEYGIDAQFETIVQAQISKLAVDEYVKLLNNKRCFEGLKFRLGKLDSDIVAKYVFMQGIHYDKNKSKQSTNVFKYCHGIIYLNRDLNWNDYPKIRRKQAIYREKSAPDMKDLIIHELAHYLHSVSSPNKYMKYMSSPTCADEVSGYACKNNREFVAEYITGKMAGKKYSGEVDDMYKIYGGPDIFKPN